MASTFRKKIEKNIKIKYEVSSVVILSQYNIEMLLE